MRRTFRNPGDVRGIPEVRRHAPRPRRETPPSATKTMLCPKDEQFGEMVTGRRIETILPSRTATVLGILGVTCALLVNSLILFHDTRFSDAFGTGGMILSLGLVHILAVFSQILSTGRNQLGPWAILVLYAGAILSAIVLHFVE